MLDAYPGVQTAFEHYKQAQTDKEAALARINGRINFSFPRPLGFLNEAFFWITVAAPLFGKELQYKEEDQTILDRAQMQEVVYLRDISRELETVVGRFSLNGVVRHPTKPRPWVVYYQVPIEGEEFDVIPSFDQVMVKKSPRAEANVEIQQGQPPLLYLPSDFRARTCTLPSHECTPPHCRFTLSDIWLVSGLTDVPQVLHDPISRT
jgi:hypothetical protein